MLDKSEFPALLKRCMPQATPSQAAYFIGMLDADGNEKISYKELIDGMRNCVELGNEEDSRRHEAYDRLVARIKSVMQREKMKPHEVFRKYDRYGTGRLSYGDLVAMARGE